MPGPELLAGLVEEAALFAKAGLLKVADLGEVGLQGAVLRHEQVDARGEAAIQSVQLADRRRLG